MWKPGIIDHSQNLTGTSSNVLQDFDNTTCELLTPTLSHVHTIKAFNTGQDLDTVSVELYLRSVNCTEHEIIIYGTMSVCLSGPNDSPRIEIKNRCKLNTNDALNDVNLCRYECANSANYLFVCIKIFKNEVVNNAYQICEIIIK